MTKIKSTNKNKACFLADSFEVVAVKDPDLKPFLNVFQFEGQNVQQQQLGKLFGIIQINDHSKNSEYLPNLLTQILKKEYYKNKNKKCSQSFEIALHKLNLTLTDLAQHEIVKWINNLNAIIGVVCEDEVHFTQIGNGCLIFLKDDKITKIDSDSNQTENYHPMKTFSFVSSGKLKENDKLILTIQETFETILIEELKRHHKTFNSDEFDNIISSTLKNEASNTAMVVVNIKKQPEELLSESIPLEEKKLEDAGSLNFFGKQKAIPPIKNNDLKNKDALETKKPEKELDSILDQSPFQYKSEIFIKEEDYLGIPSEQNKNKFDFNEIKIFAQNLYKKIKTIINKNQIKKIYFNRVSLKKISLQSNDKINKKNLIVLKNKVLNWFSVQFQKIDFKKIKFLFLKYLNLFLVFANNKLEKITTKNNSSWENSENKIVNNFANKIGLDFGLEKNNESYDLKNKIWFLLKKIKKKLKKIFKLFSGISRQKKIIIFIFIFLIILILSLSSMIKTKSPKTTFKEETKEISAEKINDSAIEIKKLIEIDKEIKDSTFLNNDLFLLTDKNSLIKFSTRDNNKTEIIIPKELKNPEYLSSIESLQLIFIIAENQVYSYSPITNSFSENLISMPTNFKNGGVGTYLTYLYLLDKNSNQIYRYYRIPGGFSEAREWLMEKENFKDAINMDVNDSIYIAFDNSKIKKYFQGKIEMEYNLEENFIPNKIRTKINQEEIFALDKKQGKLLKLSGSNHGMIFFQDLKFKNASDFSVDFENKKIFLFTEKNELLMFSNNY